MEQPRFDSLVELLERKARRSPRAYLARVLGLSLAGYLYLFVVIGVLLLAALLVPWLLLAVVPLLYFIFTSLRVRVEPPAGVPLDSADAPRLFRELEEFRRKLYFPHFHRVLLEYSFNAGVTQIPRLGILGWTRNHLTVGLPLLLSLTPDQLRAVLAHEFFHLYGGHGRLADGISRVGRVWIQLTETLHHRRHRGLILFLRFFEWYLPYLNAHFVALGRSNEYIADRFAADLAGAEHLADGLVLLHIRQAYLDEDFWQHIWKRADGEPEPPADVFEQMSAALAALDDGEDSARRLERALSARPASGGFHPALADRLAALGAPARIPPRPQESAAQRFLAAGLPAALQALSLHWRTAARPAWVERHQNVRRHRERLAHLECAEQQRPLTPAEEWDRYTHTFELSGPEAAEPFLAQFVARHPQAANPRFELGRLYLQRDDPRGVAQLERVMELDSALALDCCLLLADFHRRNASSELAELYAFRARKHQELLLLAEKERLPITQKDRFLTVPLSEDDRRSLAEQCARFRPLRAAYLVRKHVEHLPHKPFYVFAVDWRLFSPMRNLDDWLARLSRELQFPLPPGSVWVLSVYDDSRLRNRIRSVPDSRVYMRPFLASLRRSSSAPSVSP